MVSLSRVLTSGHASKGRLQVNTKEYRSQIRELHNLFEGGFDRETALAMCGITHHTHVACAREEWETWTRRLELAA
jgi:hypothetical protein